MLPTLLLKNPLMDLLQHAYGVQHHCCSNSAFEAYHCSLGARGLDVFTSPVPRESTDLVYYDLPTI